MCETTGGISVGSVNDDLRELGWTHRSFELSEEELAEYTAAARSVIEIALGSTGVKTALTLGDEGAGFGLSRARTPGLDTGKDTLQLGYQSEYHADSMLPARSQPRALKDFWPLHDHVLAAVERSSRSMLRELGGGVLEKYFVTDDTTDRNFHIRTNWYRHAVPDFKGNVLENREILSGHADRGPLTFHLYETHGGFLLGSPYDRQTAYETSVDLKRQKVQEMLTSLDAVEPQGGKVAAFLGVGWWNLPEDILGEGQRDLPALYHVGVQPNIMEFTESPWAPLVTRDEPDRFSVVAFVDPPFSALERGDYVVPTKNIARPELDI